VKFRSSDRSGGTGTLFANVRPANLASVNATQETPETRQRRLELARRAFREFYTQCFWSWQENPEITPETIPLIVRELRIHGGAKGYQLAAELCR
jgi:hypothetical protein